MPLEIPTPTGPITPVEPRYFTCLACDHNGPQVDEDSQTCAGPCRELWQSLLGGIRVARPELSNAIQVQMADAAAKAAAEMERALGAYTRPTQTGCRHCGTNGDHYCPADVGTE